MKKYFFTILFLSSISLFADNVDPTNYVNQVVGDCTALKLELSNIHNQLNTLSANTFTYRDLYVSMYGHDNFSLGLQDLGNNINTQRARVSDAMLYVDSIADTARNLVLTSSVSPGGSSTNIVVLPSVDLTVVSNLYNDVSSLLTGIYTTITRFHSDFGYAANRNHSDLLALSNTVNDVALYLTRYQYSFLRDASGKITTLTNQVSSCCNTLTSLGSTLTDILSVGSSSSNYLSTLVSSLTSTSNSQTIYDFIRLINNSCSAISGRVESIRQACESFESWFEWFDDEFNNVLIPLLEGQFSNQNNYFSIWTNRFWNLRNNNVSTSFWPSDYSYHWAGLDGGEFYNDFWEPFPSNPETLNFYTFLQWYLDNMPAYFSSLNNYAFTNMILLATIANKNFSSSNTNLIDVSSITSSIYSAANILTNSIASHFTIFDNSSPLMDFYNVTGNTTNQYYHFLTNYYIKVSTGQASGSASESHTNWFNRIEMLLGALVFRDSNEGSFSPGSTNTDGVESAYDSISQSLATAVEIPSTFQSKIENAEQSILDYMREWHSIISSGTLGSHFTLCDIHLSGFDSEPARDGSPFDGRMNLSIPIDGSLKNFLDVSRALSTVCFITLFLILSLKLIIFLLRACASITRVCYALFMAIAGH